jgi:hypothetical protein
VIVYTPRTRASFIALVLDPGEEPTWAQVFIRGTEKRAMQRATLRRTEGEPAETYWARVLGLAEHLAWAAEKHEPGEQMGTIDLSTWLRNGETDAEHNARTRKELDARNWAARKVRQIKECAQCGR